MPARVVLILQARMGSTRLPGKSMMDLAGAPLVGRILERVIRCKEVDEVVLAIPNTEENKPLAELAASYGVSVYAGDENDVLSRYTEAAKYHNADYVVRLPADNPTPEPEEIDRIIVHHRDLGRPGFSSNLSVINNNGYPDGIGSEVFDFSLLEWAQQNNPTEMQREHVHLNFFNYETGMPVDEILCPISTIECPVEFRRPDLILDVNTKEQYLFMKELYEYLYPLNPDFTILDTIRWYDEVKTK